jgi:hypothetical protein
MFETCPKCDHAPLPADQAFPAECPACGVILARIGSAPPRGHAVVVDDREPHGLRALLWHVPEQVDASAFKVRVALLAFFAIWGLRLAWMDYRDGEMAGSFIHAPLLIFHEAGHVIFRPFGQWVAVLGGTLGQLLMPRSSAARCCGRTAIRSARRSGCGCSASRCWTSRPTCTTRSIPS